MATIHTVSPRRTYTAAVIKSRPGTWSELNLRNVFCWTKFGTEAGEPATRIVARKEWERRRNGGTFLWGVGNSIRPSLTQLVQLSPEPEVVFTPMLSRPASSDAMPDSLVVWCAAMSLDGVTYELPQYSLITSRSTPGEARAHYALVCQRADPLGLEQDGDSIDSSKVRNLRTGAIVGSSQVTAVVRAVPGAAPTGRMYQVAFRASLVYPYFIRLMAPIRVPEKLRLDRLQERERKSAMLELLALKANWTSNSSSTGLS